MLPYRLERVRPFSQRSVLTPTHTSTNNPKKRPRSKRRLRQLPSQSLQGDLPPPLTPQLLMILPPSQRASSRPSPKAVTALPMTKTRMAGTEVEAEAAAVVGTAATSPTTSTSESITLTKRDSQSSRMRRTTTATILRGDTRTPPEVATVVEEAANTRRAKASVATVVDAAADPGLLKNIEIKVR